MECTQHFKYKFPVFPLVFSRAMQIIRSAHKYSNDFHNQVKIFRWLNNIRWADWIPQFKHVFFLSTQMECRIEVVQ